MQVVENLFVDVAKMLAFAQVVEVDFVDFVDHLAHQLAGFHVVVGILEHGANHASPVAGASGHLKSLQGREQVVVNEGEQFLAGDALGIGRPGTPLVALGNRRGVAGPHQLQFLVLIVDDLEKEHPAKLTDALGIAIDAGVLAHDVLDGFDEGADGHGLSNLPIESGLKVVDGRHKTFVSAKGVDQLNRGAEFVKRRGMRSTLGSSRLSTPSSAYLASSASSTARA